MSDLFREWISPASILFFIERAVKKLHKGKGQVMIIRIKNKQNIEKIMFCMFEERFGGLPVAHHTPGQP